MWRLKYYTSFSFLFAFGLIFGDMVRGIYTWWTGVDMSTQLLLEDVPETKTNPVRFYWGEGSHRGSVTFGD